MKTLDKYIGNLKHESVTVRREAVQMLGGIQDISVVPLLIEALKDSDPGVRWRSIYALKNIGADAKAAVPLLITALNDSNEEVREQVVQALKKIAPNLSRLIV